MEQPNTWVVSDDSESDRVLSGDLDDIATHRIGLAFDEGWVQGRVTGCIVLSTVHDHGFVTVDMAVGWT